MAYFQIECSLSKGTLRIECWAEREEHVVYSTPGLSQVRLL